MDLKTAMEHVALEIQFKRRKAEYHLELAEKKHVSKSYSAKHRLMSDGFRVEAEALEVIYALAEKGV